MRAIHIAAVVIAFFFATGMSGCEGESSSGGGQQACDKIVQPESITSSCGTNTLGEDNSG